MIQTKILIVDDEEEFSKTLSDRMEIRGLKVEIAKNGNEALKKVEEGTYDAIVLDMVMPGMNGIETLKKIKEKKPDFQVILLTGHATVKDGIESMKYGAVDFLEKPADIESLLKKIEDAKSKRLLLVEKSHEKKVKDILTRFGY
jgi:DNA-binding NtrC family response regulator